MESSRDPPSLLLPSYLPPLLFTTVFLSHLLPPTSYRPWVSSALIVTLLTFCFTRPISPDPATAFAVCTAVWTTALRSIRLHLHPVPAESLLHHPRHPLDGKSPLEKLRWTVALLLSPRLIPFRLYSADGPPAVPLPKTNTATSRVAPLRALACIPRVLFVFTILDLSRTYTLSQPPLISRPVTTADLVAFGISAWCGIELPYLVLVTVAVALGARSEEWPPLFGGITEAWTVRRLWGRVWHGLMRVALGGLNIQIKDKKKPAAAGLTTLATAFLLSGAGHALPVATISSGTVWRGQVYFFLVQLAAIAVETLVFRLYTPHAMRGVGRRVGYVWVLAVGWMSLGLLVREFADIGMMEKGTEPLPFSIVRGVSRRMGVWEDGGTGWQ